MRKFITFCGCLLLLVQLEAAFFKMTNFVCESFNTSSVSINNCRLKAISRGKVVLNLNITYLHPTNNMQLRATVQKKANGYKPWLFDYTVDVCQFFQRRNHPAIKLGFDLIRNFSNVNHTCPYSGDILLKDFNVDPENIPLPLPTGDYLLLLTWMFHNKRQYITNVYFTYQENLV